MTRVEVEDRSSAITEAMSRQMKAERDKRANILEAEGVKQSASSRPRSQAVRDPRAEGDAQARITRATAGPGD